MSIGWNSTLGQKARDQRRLLIDLAEYGGSAGHITVNPDLLRRTAELLADLVEAEAHG